MKHRRSLRPQIIDRDVAHYPGLYFLMGTDSDPVRYIGRADDLNEALHEWAERVAETRYYRYFSFDYEGDAYERFRRACDLYHYHSESQYRLDNEEHPQRPEGTDWTCGHCDDYG